MLSSEEQAHRTSIKKLLHVKIANVSELRKDYADIRAQISAGEYAHNAPPGVLSPESQQVPFHLAMSPLSQVRDVCRLLCILSLSIFFLDTNISLQPSNGHGSSPDRELVEARAHAASLAKEVCR